MWQSVTEALSLDAHEAMLLAEAGRTLDLLDKLTDELQRLGPLLPDGKVQPCVIEARLQRITLTRLIASLRLPPDLTDPLRRPARRPARGAYTPREF